ncbi:hypothetical protein BC940DRAFT_240047 [Gongronella butleri]|nr:hypothetical protein BC940DRAFT_240047 [Gongronella butleri]
MSADRIDPSSLSNLADIATTHLHLEWAVSFEKKVFDGSVVLDLLTLKENVPTVVLDSSYLDIKQVLYTDKSLEFQVGERQGALGSPLTIKLPEALPANTSFQLTIIYATTPQCTAVQFLTPEQTVGKKHPYLFAQCEAIHARSFIPCQDSPSVKLTYSANVTSPLRVVMSALERGVRPSSVQGEMTYSFHQPTKVPTYLITLASGNLESRELSSRCKVWSEPEVVDAAAKEFEENPCLTFVTPTLIAGDKSSVNVIIHEISHSWMGNLVTTKNWEHFWLNEGHTKFIERKILARLYGEPTAQLDMIIGLKALKESIKQFGDDAPETVLQPDLSGGGDPDDFFSTVPYEKGFNLLYHVQDVVGGASIFDPFVKEYVKHFAGKSITTQDWKAYLYAYMEKHHGQAAIERLNTIDFNAWFFGRGFLPVEPKFDTSLVDASYALADRWDAARKQNDFSAFSPKDIEGYSTGQLSVFLERLSDQDTYSHEALAAMDSTYALSKSRNSEIRFRWQSLGVKASYEPIYSDVVAFITEQGRMKYVRPLYRGLAHAKGDAPDLARRTFLAHRSFYHPIAAQLIAKDLGLA